MRSDHMPAVSDCKEFRVNMANLMTHLKKVADQRPQATYYNVDMLKYQVIEEHTIFHQISTTNLVLSQMWSKGDICCVFSCPGVGTGHPVDAIEPGAKLAR